MAGARIQLKRGTAAAWTAANTVLFLGEIGYETDTKKFKVGDGTTAWTSLTYTSVPLSLSTLNDLGDVTISSAADGDFLRWNGTAWINDAVNLGTDTTGSFVQSLVAGTGVTLTNNSGENTTPTIAIGQSVGTGDSVTFVNVTAALTGNASTATTLQTARNIAGQSFNGSANISIAPTDLTGVTSSAAEINILDGATLSTTELNYVDGVTSAIQTQIDLKAPLASPTFTGTVTVPTPTNATDAATKAYADAIAAGINWHESVELATATTLPNSPTYDNGTSGVGSTLTATSNGRLSVDGVNATTGDRILVKDQATATQNGIYVVTAQGSAGATYLLTRATDHDGANDDIVRGDAVYVGNGSSNINQGFLVNSVGSSGARELHVVGTDNITFTQFTGTANITAGTGITKTGNSLAIGQAVETNSSVTFTQVTAALVGNASTATTLQTARNIAGQSFDGSANISIAPTDLTGVTSTAAELNILDGATLSTTELNYVDGVTSAIQTQLDAKAPLASPTFTGTVSGITSTMVGLGNVDNTSNATERAATATLTNKTLTSPVINTPTGIVKGDVGLGNVDNTSDANKPVSTAQQTALDLKANLASPTFTGTVTIPTGASITAPTGLVKGDVGLGNVDNTSDVNKPVSTATQTALDLKAPLASPTFTGTVTVPDNSFALGTKTTGLYIASTDAVDGMNVRYIPFADVASYAGEYNGGASYAIGVIVSTGVGSPYGTSGELFVRVGNQGNPGYPPGSASWSVYSHQTSPSEGCLAVFAVDDTIMQVRVADVSDTEISYLNGVTSAIQTQIDTKAPIASPTFTGTVTIPTGASITAPNGLVKGDVGLGDVDNTSDANKPVSTATQTALDLKANLASPTFTGTVTVPAPTNNTDAATKLYVDTTVSGASISALNDIGDVTITAAANGDYLKWNGTAFVNDDIDLGTDTTGDYVATITGGTGVTSSAATTGEGTAHTLSIGQAVGTSDNVTFAGVTADNIKVGVTAANEIDTVSGDLTIDSAGGTVTIDDNLTVTGNLTVSGTTTSVNTETLTVDDNIIVLNNNATGAPSENAGIEVERGSSANVALRWNETSDKWEITADGSTYANIATETYAASLTPATLNDIGDVTITSASSGQFLKWNGTAWVNDAIDLGTDTTGNYVSGVTAGSGITVTHTPGEGSSPTIAVTANTFEVSGSISTHAAITTNVHGIADTSILVTTTGTQTLTNKTITSPSGLVKGDVGLGNVDNTADTAKPVSTAQQTALNLKANLASPTFTGTVTIPSGASISGFAPLASPTFTGTVTVPTPTNGTDAANKTYADGVVTAAKIITAAGGDGTAGQALTTNGSGTLDFTTITGTTEASIISAVGGDGSSGQVLKTNGSGDLSFGDVALGTNTTGNYMADVSAGTGISITHTPAEGSTATIALADVSTSAQTASYTLVLDDKNKIVEMNVASANNLTIPPNSSVAFPVGSQINILQVGAGQTTIVAGSGVTVNATPGLKMRAQFSYATCIKRATNTWVLVGDLSA